jgi:hypothetical protein
MKLSEGTSQPGRNPATPRCVLEITASPSHPEPAMNLLTLPTPSDRGASLASNELAAPPHGGGHALDLVAAVALVAFAAALVLTFAGGS